MPMGTVVGFNEYQQSFIVRYANSCYSFFRLQIPLEAKMGDVMQWTQGGPGVVLNNLTQNRTNVRVDSERFRLFRREAEALLGG